MNSQVGECLHLSCVLLAAVLVFSIYDLPRPVFLFSVLRRRTEEARRLARRPATLNGDKGEGHFVNRLGSPRYLPKKWLVAFFLSFGVTNH